jgi:hypothetical protein
VLTHMKLSELSFVEMRLDFKSKVNFTPKFWVS